MELLIIIKASQSRLGYEPTKSTIVLEDNIVFTEGRRKEIIDMMIKLYNVNDDDVYVTELYPKDAKKIINFAKLHEG